jgi:tetratricopeptide (TPR) repeat protein
LLLIQLGRIDDGLSELDIAVRLSSRHAVIYRAIVHRDRGWAFAKLRRDQEALIDFNRSIALNDQSAETYFNRGVIFIRQKHFYKALADCDRAIELDPDDPGPHCLRGMVLGELERPKEAIIAFEASIACDPSFEAAYIGRGYLKVWKLKCNDEALADFDHVLDHLNPNSRAGHVRSGLNFS